MKRRDFLRSSAAVCALAAFPLVGGVPQRTLSTYTFSGANVSAAIDPGERRYICFVAREQNTGVATVSFNGAPLRRISDLTEVARYTLPSRDEGSVWWGKSPEV